MNIVVDGITHAVPEQDQDEDLLTAALHLAEIPEGWLDEAEQVINGAQQILGERPLTSPSPRPIPVLQPTQPQPQPAQSELEFIEPNMLTEAKPSKVQVTWYTKSDLPEDVELLQELSNGQWVVTYNNKRTQTMSARVLVENVLNLLSKSKSQPRQERTVSRKAVPARRMVEETVEEEIPEGERELLNTLGEIMEGWAG